MVEDDFDPSPSAPLPLPSPDAATSSPFSTEEALLVESLAELSDDAVRALPSLFVNDDLKNRILASRQ